MVWLGERRGYLVDWTTQRWVQLTGRRSVLAEVPWLDGPRGAVEGTGADFFERWAEARGLTVVPARPDAGLLDDFGVLASDDFDPAAVDPRIAAFYERTSAFDLEIATRWSGVFRPFGWLIARIFARRLAQLNLPLSDRELEGGVHSRIVRVTGADGRLRHCGWVRTAVDTGAPIFVGDYGPARIPGCAGPCVRVVFPLPNGNAIVLLRPRVEAGGGLTLVSDGRRFGDPGFYFTVDAGDGEIWTRDLRTMKERLSLWVDGDAIRGVHRFFVFGLSFLELRYRITARRGSRQSSSGAGSTSVSSKP